MRARRMLMAGAIAAVAVLGPLATAAPAIAAPEAVSGGYYATKQNCDNMGAWLKQQHGYTYWFCRFETNHDPPWHLYMQ